MTTTLATYRTHHLLAFLATIVLVTPARTQDGDRANVAIERRDVEPYDLDRCVSEAVATSARLLAGVHEWKAADARTRRAIAERLPSISASGRYSYASEVGSFDIPIGTETRHVQLGDHDRAEFALGMDVPLYTGGRLGASLRAERAAARAALLDTGADSLHLVRDVRGTYFSALGARAQAEAARVAVSRLERMLDMVTSRMETGVATREAYVQTVARLREAESRVLTAAEAVETTELRLGRLVGRPGERIEPRGGLDRSLLDDIGGGGNVRGRPELAALRSLEESKVALARAASATLLPSIGASAQANIGRPGLDVMKRDWMSWVSASVTVNWRLWDFGAIRSESRAAAAAADAIAARRTDLQRELDAQLAEVRTHLRVANAQLHTIESRADAERERLTLVEGRYRQGMATETEILDANDDLAAVEADVAATRAAVRLAEVEVLHVVGR